MSNKPKYTRYIGCRELAILLLAGGVAIWAILKVF